MAESLPIPDAALRDPSAVNMASLWVAEKGLHCKLKIGIYENHPTVTETTAWGIILANMAKAIADAMIADGAAQGSRDEVVNLIWTSFHEELSKPPSA